MPCLGQKYIQKSYEYIESIFWSPQSLQRGNTKTPYENISLVPRNPTQEAVFMPLVSNMSVNIFFNNLLNTFSSLAHGAHINIIRSLKLWASLGLYPPFFHDKHQKETTRPSVVLSVHSSDQVPARCHWKRSIKVRNETLSISWIGALDVDQNQVSKKNNNLCYNIT